MIVRAAPRTKPGWSSASLLLRVAAVLGCEFLSTGPAAAQLVGSIGLDSDYRSRGYSLTNGHPAFSAQFTYDHSSGAYVSLSALTQIGGQNRFLGGIANVGYAKRLNRRVTLDVGVLRSQIRSAYDRSNGYEYTEFYTGASVKGVTGRIYYSPDYRGYGSTVYGELEAGFEPVARWRLNGHVGLLTYLSTTRIYRAGETHHDWQISVGRQVGRAEVHAALSGGGPRTYYGYGLHKKAVFSVGASYGF